MEVLWTQVLLKSNATTDYLPVCAQLLQTGSVLEVVFLCSKHPPSQLIVVGEEVAQAAAVVISASSSTAGILSTATEGGGG